MLAQAAATVWAAVSSPGAGEQHAPHPAPPAADPAHTAPQPLGARRRFSAAVLQKQPAHLPSFLGDGPLHPQQRRLGLPGSLAQQLGHLLDHAHLPVHRLLGHLQGLGPRPLKLGAVLFFLSHIPQHHDHIACRGRHCRKAHLLVVLRQLAGHIQHSPLGQVGQAACQVLAHIPPAARPAPDTQHGPGLGVVLHQFALGGQQQDGIGRILHHQVGGGLRFFPHIRQAHLHIRLALQHGNGLVPAGGVPAGAAIEPVFRRCFAGACQNGGDLLFGGLGSPAAGRPVLGLQLYLHLLRQGRRAFPSCAGQRPAAVLSSPAAAFCPRTPGPWTQEPSQALISRK